MKENNLVEHRMDKKFFDFTNSNDLKQHNLQVHQGFKVACEMYSGGLKVLIDPCTKVISSRNLWQEYLERRLDQKNKQEIEKFFIGKLVVATYGNHREYLLKGVDFSRTPLSAFENSNISNYLEYFR